jgi:murein DD-endopeptidase MepM/ murein hydrolase activator NlpD
LSPIKSLFFEESEASVEKTPNSQTINLLQAPRNIDPIRARGGGEVIIEGNALVSVDGPTVILGTGAGGSSIENNILRQTGMAFYVVREGDSLSGIAKMFDVDANTIMWANDIVRATEIQSGQVMIIPPVKGVIHKVRSGDTIASIAKRYKVPVAEITGYNDIPAGDTLVIGETLLVPGGVEESAKPAQKRTSLPRTATLRGLGGPSIPGYFIWPVNGGELTQGLHGHNGKDIGAPMGTEVYASAQGTVVIARSEGNNGGYGKFIAIDHPNGTQTLYAHLSGIAVTSGQFVYQGQVIGFVGSTGRSTGPHLHFEVHGAANPF